MYTRLTEGRRTEAVGRMREEFIGQFRDKRQNISEREKRGTRQFLFG